MEDKRFIIELEVITPLAVGAGNEKDWVKGLDFVQKGDKVYVIDMHKVATQGIDIEKLTSLFLKSDERGISLLVGDKIADISRYVFDSPVGTSNNIKSFLRTELYDKPLVAGSSIKGSIRSALFNYLRTDEGKNEDVFGSMKDGTDFMRFVRIGDIEMPSTILVNTKLFNLRKEENNVQGGWKETISQTSANYNSYGFNTLYECVAPGNKGYGSISLALNAFNLLEKSEKHHMPYHEKKNLLINSPLQATFKVVNNVTRAYLLKEKAFFEKYETDRTEEIIGCINKLLSMIPTDGSSCLMKMSAGVGFHSITGDWQYDDYDNTGLWTEKESKKDAGKKRYKSRKIAEYNGQLQFMGFVKLRQLDPEEYKEAEHQLTTEHKDLIEAILAPINKREEEKKRFEEEQRMRQIKAQEDAAKRKEYEALMEQARQFYGNGQWDSAIEAMTKAATYDIKDQERAKLLELCMSSKSADEFRQKEAAEASKKMCMPLHEVIRGKASAGNLIGTTVRWLKADSNTFGQSELDALLCEAQLLPAKEKKNLQSNLPALTKIVSPEMADQLNEQIKNMK